MTYKKSGSRIFEGFRALGLQSSDLPHVLKYHRPRKEYMIYCVVGKVVHSYHCPKLTLKTVSNQHKAEIECLAADEVYLYTSCRNVVYGLAQSQSIKYTFKGHQHPVHIILPFDKHLITVDKESSVMVWHIESESQYLSLEFNNSTFEITAALHPITYVNKILFGSRQGTMQLWNISKNKMIYEFVGLPSSPITVLQQAPALDVVGVGNEDGDIVLLNLKIDRVVMQFRQDGGRVTALSFRTDGQTIMTAGNIMGHVYLWDLETRKVQGMIENAHTGAVCGASFVDNKSLLVTNSGDNSVKIWQFEKGSGDGTLLHQIFGHKGSLTKIRFYDDESIISAGSDSTLKIFSCVHKAPRNLGQATLDRKRARKRGFKLDDGKLPPIVDFAVESAREGEWDGLVAAHYRHPVATTWNLHCNRMGSYKFMYDEATLSTEDNRAVDGRMFVSSVACTSCGNFCLIGYNKGYLDLYNIQSGIHRGSYIDQSVGKKKAHESRVKSLHVDALNQLTVSVGAEGKVKFWKFKQKNLLQSMDLYDLPSFAHLHRASSLLAVVFDDFTFCIIDVETRRIVRRFSGHISTINDIAWSEDGRWIVSAGTDCCVKTWDIPSVALIDCFLVDSAVVSLSFSPASDFLATAHVDDPGIYLWSNRTLYGYVNLAPIPQDFHPDIAIDLPSTALPGDGEEIDAEGIESDFEEMQLSSKEQLSVELITLSSVPYAKWANVLQLETIRKRNKPKEPPKVPKNAPFFLPTVASLNPEFLINEDEEKSRVARVDPVQSFSNFALTLLNSRGNYDEFLTLLKSLSLLEIDTEIRALAPDGGGSIGLLELFLDFVENAIESKQNFEIVQAYLSLFLSLHTESLSKVHDIDTILIRIDSKLNKDRIDLSNLLNESQCIVNYIKSATL